ncbi:MAG TPA: AAA family ATPase [Acidimicrobiales bacterium]
MSDAHFLILTGPPGAGKTTVGRLVAEAFEPSVALESDFFWAAIVNGQIPPWEFESAEQNRTMIRASLAAATCLVASGYVTVLEGIVGPWFFNLLREELYDVSATISYVVLRPTLEDCLFRSKDRRRDPRHAGALSEEEPIRRLYSQFESLGSHERNVIDTSLLSIDETVQLIVDDLNGPGKYVVAP